MDEMLDYAAQVGFEGIDLTGYYFPGYPEVPPDEYIYHIKHKAFSLGIEICGSGVRNDFAQADPAARMAAMKHVKEWVEVVSKLGGQTLRIFSGNNVPAGHSRTEVFQWVVACINECAEYARNHGVILAIQNHNDFLKTAGQVEELLQAINSEWVGLMLDIGSYQTADPYDEIRQTVKYAITWQIKEEVYINGKATKTDLDKMKTIIDNAGYRGYMPIETLGEGDPKQKIAYMFSEVKKRFG
jgi:sugar phosphate isomerase/epimerase